MKLYQHQIDVLEQTKDQNRCAYYLDMGLGKTFVGSEKMEQLNANVNLLVCQKSKIADWIKHFQTYYHIHVYNLTKPKEFDLFFATIASEKYKCVGVINYDLVFRRRDLLKLSNFTLMLDESSLISNEKAKRSKFILKLKPKNVILLSGTPTAGKYERLWSQCRLLGWDISKSTFWSSYVISEWIDINGFMHEIVIGYKNIDHLKSRLKEYGAVFLKTNEVLSLPDQIEQKIFVPQNKLYKKFKKDKYLMLDDGKELVGDNALTEILYQRQLCGQYSEDKMKAFQDLVESTEDRLVVFYNFTDEWHKLKEITDRLGRPSGVVNGQFKNPEVLDKYDNGILFVQYQAGAYGLNLQSANKVVYYSLPLGKGSCDLWEQSKKRIHRIGQNKTCFYYYLLVEKSIEEWNLSLLNEGKELTDTLFIKSFL